MNALEVFGLLSLSAGLVFYALERKHRGAVLGFAVACLGGSVYGFLLPGGWPFGAVEAVWAVVAFVRWWKLRAPHNER